MGKTVLLNVLTIAIGRVYIKTSHAKIVRKVGEIIAKVILNDLQYFLGSYVLVLFSFYGGILLNNMISSLLLSPFCKVFSVI